MNGFIQKSRKSILGLDSLISGIQANVANNSTDISDEITRAETAEGNLSGRINTEKSRIDILNSDATTTGSVDKKIADATESLASATNVYTKSEVDDELANKLDSTLVLSTVTTTNKIATQAELNTKANSDDVYDRTTIDNSLSTKADANKTYSKTEVDEALGDKADASRTYSKTEVDTALSDKADTSNIYDKAHIDTELDKKISRSNSVSTVSSTNKVVTETELGSKANSSDVYTQSELDTKLDGKLNTGLGITAISDTNKIATQTELNSKANSSDIYTRSEVDTALDSKANTTDIGKVGPSKKIVDETNIADGKVVSYDASNDRLVYVEQDSGTSIDDENSTTTTTYSSSKIDSELNSKANSSDVYTQSEVDTKISSASQGISYTVADTTELNNITGMTDDEHALVESDRYVYKYDSTDGWERFYAMDATHNHDDLYYTKTETDTKLDNKADSSTTYSITEVDTALDGKADASSAGKVGPNLLTVDETNKSNGYVLSYDSSNDKLEYVEQTAGTSIDDENSTTTTTYSSSKIDSELNSKANSSDVYTQSEVDTKLDGKLNTGLGITAISTNNKIATETELSSKADSSTTYTIDEVDTALSNKVGTSDVSGTISDTNKVITQSAISGFVDSGSLYVKTEIDTKLANKADSSTTYTMSEVDTALGNKIDLSQTVSTVSGTNKVVTQNEISGFADASTVYTKTESDTLLNDKADSSTTYTKTEVDSITDSKADKVDDVKGTLSSTNKLMTESDVDDKVSSAGTTSTLPMLEIDRPTMSTKSVSENDYTFTFPLTKTPHGSNVVNDEITIYNFHEDGTAAIFEGVEVFSDKHGEITATLADSSEETKYHKQIKVCYLTTDEQAPVGSTFDNPIIIDAGVEFESQGSGTTTYSIDFSQGDYYKITFTDGFYTMVVHDTSHTDFNTSNTTDYEADHINPEGTQKSTDWPGTDGDEVQYTLYNWTMDLAQDSGDVYTLSFTQNAEVGGGAL